MLNIYSFAAAFFAAILGMAVLTRYRYWRSFLGGLLFIAGITPLIYQQVLIHRMSDKPVATSLAQVTLEELRKVTLEFEDGSANSFLVHKSEAEKLVEASKRLHFEPGINPHNGGATARIKRISVWSADMSGPYWWSTPDLKRNYDEKGARIYDFLVQKSSWTAPGKR